jgi:hypothetical protein
MRHVAPDLPDPTEEPVAPTGDADELLAQLAGEEVDRLTGGREKSEVAERMETRAAELPPAHPRPPAPVDAPPASRSQRGMGILGWIALAMTAVAVATIAYAAWSRAQP